MVNDIAIVGGGTSGLVTALLLRRQFPTLKIDLIESKAIGIVGVGEGSTEHWTTFMYEVGIDLAELVRETDATFKYGINFQNWNGDNKNYIQSVSNDYNLEGPSGTKIVYNYLIANGYEPKDLTHWFIEPSLIREGQYGVQQFHFNTFKLNEYLHKLCSSRDINFIDAEISEINLDDDGYITSLDAKDGRRFTHEFYVDSTGFGKVIMHKKLGIPWKSYADYLPVNSAIAFPTERTEDIPAWTSSRAMKHGWSWRIPTQDRYGNGYVFSDKYTDFEGAQKEMEELLGYPIEVAKKIKFEAGCLEKFWHKNCVGIGLAGSFIEPLEASSIGTSIQQSMLLNKFLPGYVKGKENLVATTYNTHCAEILDNILDFVALHYRVKRDDTEFWKSTKDLPLPPGLKARLDLYNHKLPSSAEFDNYNVLFRESNWILVMHGLGLIDQQVAINNLNREAKYVIDNVPLNIKHMLGEQPGDKFISHRQSLENLMNTKCNHQ